MPAKILVVANPAESASIASWLLGAGLDVRAGDGSDETLADLRREPVDVVVLATGLVASDDGAFARALGEGEEARPALVVVGDPRGAVRTALDAVALGADRFLGRPLTRVALEFAIRSCLRGRPEAPAAQPPVPAGVAGTAPAAGAVRDAVGLLAAPFAGDASAVRGGAAAAGLADLVTGDGRGALDARIAEATRRAIDDFLHDVVEHALAAPPPEDEPDEIDEADDQPHELHEIDEINEIDEPDDQPHEIDEPDDQPHEIDGEPDAQLKRRDGIVDQAFDRHAVGNAADPGRDAGEPLGAAAAEDLIEGALPHAAAEGALAVDARWGAAGEEPPPEPDDADFDAELAARAAADFEEELARVAAVDEEAERDGAPVPDAAPARVGAAPPDAPPWREPTVILSGVTPPPVALVSAPTLHPRVPDDGRAGTFVSELRRHMSAVEARLFGGGEPGAGAGAGAYDDEPPPEIDLDAIHVTVPRLPAEPGLDGAGLADGSAAPLHDEGDTGRRATGSAPGSSRRGDLRDEEVPLLLARLHREAFSGRVTFRRGEATKNVFLAEGRPVFATSNLPHDRMGDLLYREGKITREQHARSREIVAETGRRMGEILVDMGFLKRRELLPAVRRHVEDVVYSLFAWDDGTFTTTPGDSAQDEKIRLATHPAAVILEGIRRKLGLQRLRERLGSPSVVITPLPREILVDALGDAGLSPEERDAIDLLDGRRTLADVMAAAQLDETAVYQLAYGLVALGLARLAEPGRERSDTGRAVVLTPAGTITGAADVRIDRERVLAKHAHVREADYFTVLGVRRDATAFEIRRAYEAARRDYAPEGFPAEVQRELAVELQEVAAVLDEAHRILRHDGVRAAYLAHLRD